MIDAIVSKLMNIVKKHWQTFLYKKNYLPDPPIWWNVYVSYHIQKAVKIPTLQTINNRIREDILNYKCYTLIASSSPSPFYLPCSWIFPPGDVLCPFVPRDGSHVAHPSALWVSCGACDACHDWPPGLSIVKLHVYCVLRIRSFFLPFQGFDWPRQHDGSGGISWRNGCGHRACRSWLFCQVPPPFKNKSKLKLCASVKVENLVMTFQIFAKTSSSKYWDISNFTNLTENLQYILDAVKSVGR